MKIKDKYFYFFIYNYIEVYIIIVFILLSLIFYLLFDFVVLIEDKAFNSYYFEQNAKNLIKNGKMLFYRLIL